MKHTVELDTVKIADRLDNLARDLRVLGLACDALEDADDNSGAVANKIFEVASAISEVSDEVHPPLSKKEMAAKRREWKAERNGQTSPEKAMRQISEDRREAKIKAEQERQGVK